MYETVEQIWLADLKLSINLVAFKPSMKQKTHEFKMLQIEILVYESSLNSVLIIPNVNFLDKLI